jgi:membrane protein DedA with SNARE-associated domain
VGTFVAALHKLVGFDLAWLAKVVSLVALPFAHEDLAIVLGGYIIVNDLMPAGMVVGSIYGGMVVSDFALYAVGAGARSLPWLRTLAVDERVCRFGDMLKRNVFELVALCRLVPGLVFVAFVACGWARVSLVRFTAASLLVSAIYLPPILYLVTVFGDALDDRLGVWAWPTLLGALAAVGFVRERVLAFTDRTPPDNDEGATGRAKLHSPRPISGSPGAFAAHHHVPAWLLRLPVLFYWIRLAVAYRSFTLPSAANPMLPVGGLWADSKSERLLAVPADMRGSIVDFVVLRRRADPSTLALDVDRALQLLETEQIAFPLVAKPDMGAHGRCVRVIEDRAALQAYLAAFPAGSKLMLQAHAPGSGLATVLYARCPGEARGQVLALVLHDAPDRSAQDGSGCLTPELEAKLDAIARNLPEFHYGRFKLRFRSLDALARGEDFTILEIGGIGGDPLDLFDPRLSLTKNWRRTFEHQRILYLVAASNRARGFAVSPLSEFFWCFLEQYQLERRYPPWDWD